MTHNKRYMVGEKVRLKAVPAVPMEKQVLKSLVVSIACLMSFACGGGVETVETGTISDDGGVDGAGGGADTGTDAGGDSRSGDVIGDAQTAEDVGEDSGIAGDAGDGVEDAGTLDSGSDAGPDDGGSSGLAAAGHWLELDGRRILLVGDSVTQGWMELGADFDQNAYVDVLASRGINAVLLWSYIGVTDQPGDFRIGYDAPEVWPWNRVGGKFDLASFNDEYFARLRQFILYAGSRGIVVIITVHDGWTKQRFAGHPFNAALGGPLTSNSDYVLLADYDSEMPSAYDPSWNWKQKLQYHLERFCEKLVETTGDLPNVAYEIFNEGEWYDRAALESFEKHFLGFFKKRTGAPLVVNDVFGGEAIRGEPLCDVLSWHFPNWRRSSTTADFFDAYAGAEGFAGSPAKPLFFTEPVFSEQVSQWEGDPAITDGIMRMMWGTAVGGAGFVFQNDASFGFAPKAAFAAKAAIRDSILDLEGHCARFFNTEGVDLTGMSPHGDLSSTGVCLAAPKRGEYVVYSQSGATFTLDLASQTGVFKGRFYNPRTGKFEPEFQAEGGAVMTMTKPGGEDWVLHLAK